MIDKPTTTSRSEFLRVSALGVGAGVIALSANSPLLGAPSDGRRGYVVTVAGEGVNAPDVLVLSV